MLLCSRIVASMCVYIAVVNGLLYILFTTFTFVFEDVYRFSTESAELSFLGSGAGMLSGLAFVGILNDGLLQRKEASGKVITPEDRLPLQIIPPAFVLSSRWD